MSRTSLCDDSCNVNSRSQIHLDPLPDVISSRPPGRVRSSAETQSSIVRFSSANERRRGNSAVGDGHVFHAKGNCAVGRG